MAEQLTDFDRQIVALIELGYMRWKIAEELGVGENTVRRHIRDLCTRYSCPMRDLPTAVKEGWESY
jgi:DNA-binding NarL/FixJ family response regulator